MKTRGLAISAIFLLAACDEKSAPADQQAPHIAVKKASTSALGDRSSPEEEAVQPGNAKSSERPKNQVKKPPLAEPAKGQPGKVISPFTGNPVDVSGKTPGDLVGDPKFPGDESKKFVVPEGVDTDEKNVLVARPVPGKPGFVFSPHNNQVIDVTGMPAGLLVADPTYPVAEKKYLRIPAASESGGPSSEGDKGNGLPPMPDRQGDLGE